MCGITGLLHTDGRPVDPVVIAAMTEALAHRGPDDDGTWEAGPVALGHRRLSIIDPSTGQQPLTSEDGRYVISYNGECYNFVELRQDLEARGHTFSTRCDTEVVLAAYREWGGSCVERMRGMFALGIIDLPARKLFLARDQLGIKPLYYASWGGTFAFASEIQALLRVPGIPRDIDLTAVDQYLHLQYIPPPRSVYRAIRKLPPAHRLWVDLDGAPTEPEEYWRVTFSPVAGRTEDEWVEALDEVLRESVQAHLVADVPFGSFLSGGVDSAAIVTYMARILDRPVKTFTIGFEDPAHDESDHARIVAQRWGTDHVREVVRPDALAILPDLVRHHGEPFGDPSAVPTFHVSRLARTEVPMVLSGDGGDEAFGGYDTYSSWLAWLRFDDTPAWKEALWPVARGLAPGRYASRKPDLVNWLSFVHQITPPGRRRLWRSEHHGILDAPLELFEREFGRCAGLGPLEMAQYLDLKSYLPSAILTKVDVASMMHGLEVRTPLVDRKVIEFAATLPTELKVVRRTDGRFEGKRLLKLLMRRTFGHSFLHRPKQGFGLPLSVWLGPGGAQQQTVGDRLVDAGSPLHEFLDPAAIADLVENAETGPLWLLLVLDEWLRQRCE